MAAFTEPPYRSGHSMLMYPVSEALGPSCLAHAGALQPISPLPISMALSLVKGLLECQLFCSYSSSTPTMLPSPGSFVP